MYMKGNLYLADWYDRKGKRKRKSFATAAAAQAYEDSQKAIVRPKKKGEGQPLRKLSPDSSASGGEVRKGGQYARSSRSLAQSDHATLPRSTSTRSTRTRSKAKAPSQGRPAPPPSAVSSATFTRTMGQHVSKRKSSTKPSRARGTSRPRQKSGRES